MRRQPPRGGVFQRRDDSFAETVRLARWLIGEGAASREAAKLAAQFTPWHWHDIERGVGRFVYRPRRTTK
jgi:hypothetical protein